MGAGAFRLSHTRRREKGRRVFLFTSLLRHTLAKKPLLSSPAVAAWSKVQGTDSVAASASVAAAKEGPTDRRRLKRSSLTSFSFFLPPFLLSKSKSRSLLPPPPLPPFRSLVARKRERRGERERERNRERKKEERRV